jgi:hypothetical protein
MRREEVVQQSTPPRRGAEHMPDDAPEIASADHGVLDVMDGGEGAAAPFSCPECSGVGVGGSAPGRQ